MYALLSTYFNFFTHRVFSELYNDLDVFIIKFVISDSRIKNYNENKNSLSI